MPYTIVMLPKVRGQLPRLPADWQDTVLDRIKDLALEPKPREAIRVSDTPGLYRLPVRVPSIPGVRLGGEITVLYRVHVDDALVRVRRLTYRLR